MIRTTITAAALAACLLATGAFAQEDDERFERVPNSIKYQDSKPNAKGIGELAVVETRALLSQNGTATLEVTTGDLDTGTPSSTANITKVQLTLNDVTTNYNHLDEGNAFTLPLSGVQRYTPFEAHVNVMGLNGGNTEVVRVADVVRRRPDLRIISVNGPGAVRANQPFNIVAEIRELNGDIGARTNCVLTANGVVVDRADNIWVDAGDTVQCVFSQTLDRLGPNGYLVKLENTRPADWNTRSGELVGVSVLVATDKQWELQARQRVIRTTYVETSSAAPDRPNAGESTETTDSMNFHAVIDAPIDIATMRMSIQEKTDGQLIYEYPIVGGFLPGTQCRSSDRKHAMYNVCRFENGLALSATSVGSNAVYLSHFWTSKFDPATGQNVYTRRTMTTTSKFGPLRRYGDTYELRITLQDTDGDYWEVHPFLNLVPYENPMESETTYREYAGDTYRTDTTYQETGKTGSASLD